MKRGAERAELPAKRLIDWLERSTSGFHHWKDGNGKANEHNRRIPRDCWLAACERQANLDEHERHPMEGYRRLPFMMLDDDIVVTRSKARGSSHTTKQNRAAAKAVA